MFHLSCYSGKKNQILEESDVGKTQEFVSQPWEQPVFLISSGCCLSRPEDISGSVALEDSPPGNLCHCPCSVLDCSQSPFLRMLLCSLFKLVFQLGAAIKFSNQFFSFQLASKLFYKIFQSPVKTFQWNTRKCNKLCSCAFNPW